MTISTYRDLIVWQKAVAFVTRNYEVTRRFPDDERFGLTSQIRRCSVSIRSNIAEGFGRHATNDYIRFLRIALGSLCEVQTQLLISMNLSFVNDETYNELDQTTRELERMLTSMIRKIIQKEP
jgi:four helix bundle protein